MTDIRNTMMTELLKAIEIREKLYVANPEAYASDLAVSYTCLAALYFDCKKADKFEIVKNKLVEIAARHPDNGEIQGFPKLVESLNSD